MKRPLLKRSPLAILVAIAILAYWPVAFGIYTFQWDMLDVILPFRYFAGECIRHGVFPLWNPYLLTGSPVCADLQYPLWSPEVWLVGLTSGYSIYTLHFLFMGYLVLAGYGMYRLTLYFNRHKTSALVAGAAYMLSGFFTGHGQALFAIVGAAWLPWVVLYMIKNCEKPSLYRTIKLAVVIFMMISTGYQFISIITAYLLLAIFIYYGARFSQKGGTLRTFLRYNGLLVILVLGLCLVILVPLLQVLDYNLRVSSGVLYAKSILFPFNWRSLISLIAPFATVKYPDFFQTDISMRNMYVGLILLLVFVATIFRKKTGLQWLILAFGFVCLLASFGPALPVHKLMFRFLPLIHNLRMPAYFNLFFVFALIVTAGIHLPQILDRTGKYIRNLYIFGLLAVAAMSVLLLFSIFHVSPAFPNFRELFHHHDEFLRSLNFHEHLVLQLPFQIILVIVLLMYLRFGNTERYIQFVIPFLIFLEMIVAVNLNSYFTVYYTFRPGDVQRFMNAQPEGFPVPDHTSIADNSDKMLKQGPLWRNMGILTKKISYDGFSSFILNPYNFLDDSIPGLRDAVIRNPPVYVSGKVYKNREVMLRNRAFTKKDLFIPEEVYNSLPVYLKRNSSRDMLTYVSFSPNHITVDCNLDTASVITYLQADYPGWKVSIDGGNTSHFTSNFMYISALVPAGNHRVTFRYENQPVFVSFIFSCSVFIILLCCLIYLAFWRARAGFVR